MARRNLLGEDFAGPRSSLVSPLSLSLISTFSLYSLLSRCRTWAQVLPRWSVMGKYLAGLLVGVMGGTVSQKGSTCMSRTWRTRRGSAPAGATRAGPGRGPRSCRRGLGKCAGRGRLLGKLCLGPKQTRGPGPGTGRRVRSFPVRCRT